MVEGEFCCMFDLVRELTIEHRFTFPSVCFGVSWMAQDYLAVPGTMVDIEWLFLKMGDMVAWKRQRLTGRDDTGDAAS